MSAEEGEFFKWFLALKDHQEFPELVQRIAKVARALDDDGAWRLEFSLFWQAWRAVTWRPQRDLESVRRELDAGLTPADIPVYGPIFYWQWLQHQAQASRPRGTKTRHPTAAVMLAAQLGHSFKELKLPIDWVMLSQLTEVAGVPGHTDPASLRVSAARIIKEAREGKVLILGWPQDTGTTMESVAAFIQRFSGVA